MRNFKLILEYNGTGFCGWQKQIKGRRTVQGHLEEKLKKIFKKQIHCIGSGRTDSGVHALGQVAHFKAHTAMKPQQIQKALNAFLDPDVAVLKVEEVPLSFHAQYNAKSKTYRYIILNRFYPSALWRNRACFYPYKLNLSWMRKASGDLKGRHDFKCFQAAATSDPVKNSTRTISSLSIQKQEDFIYITVTANGFLYKMVRNIVGVLLAIGSGQNPKDCIPKLLKSKDRTLAPATAPSYGLYLVSVSY